MTTPTQPIIALDVSTLAEARAIVARLGNRATFYKVGLQLFASAGPPAVEWLHAEGKRVFLDLKLHDIPNTVARAAESAARLGVSLLTVHALGGEAMVRAAVDVAAERTGILAVTLLTSMDLEAVGTAFGRPVRSFEEEVVRLARVARSAGAHGVVCAGTECAAVRALGAPPLAVLVPGIRFAGGAAHDQSRVVTPADAARAGATYIVLGRAVTAADDPAEALQRAAAELA